MNQSLSQASLFPFPRNAILLGASILLALASHAQTPDPGVPFDPGTSVGSTNLTWITGGDQPWTQNTVVFDAGAASVSSGAIGDSQTSWLETTVTGPGQIYFRWAVASEAGYDMFDFRVGGAVVSEYSGIFPWTSQTSTVTQVGPVKLRWAYSKDGSVFDSRDQAYLDQVLWVPDGSGGLSVRIDGNGTGAVTSSDAGATIDCGPKCVATAALSATITLEATPETGSVFEGWSGECMGTQTTCQVTVDVLSEVVAHFSTASLPEGLANNVALTGLGGRALSVSDFYVDVPAGASDLVIRIDDANPSTDNSAFMQVAHGQPPASDDYDCFPLVSNARQVCAFASPQAGRYYITVGGLSDVFSGLELKASYALGGTSHALSVSASTGGRVVSSNVIFPVTKVEEPIYSTQVIGGRDTTIEQWPWQVQLIRAGKPFCSGSLLSDEWVVTAAHCFDGGAPSSLALGRTALTAGGIVRSAAEVIIHEEYTGSSFDYDIALIRLDTPVTFGSTISPIELLSAEQEPNLAQDGVLGSVTGWGLARENAQPDQLQVADVAMISPEACRSSGYPASGITDRMICAGFVEGGIDACGGDSGGPLVVRDRLGGHRLAGITSWGDGCAKPDFPGVYTRVSAFADWISDKTSLTFSDRILDCGLNCQVTLPHNTALTLVPQPDPGHYFVSFDGGCAGQSVCPLTINAPRTVNAIFAPISIFEDRFEAQ